MNHHPTRERLISSVLALSQDVDFERIKIDDVLGHSTVSRGSLYHHFENFEELIAVSMARSFALGVDQSIEMMNNTLSKTESSADFREGVRKSIQQTLTLDGINFRLSRARIIGLSAKYPKIRDYIAKELIRLSSAIEDLIARAQKMGWVKPEIDLKAIVIFIQAYTFGKIIDDILDDRIENDRWSNFISDIIDKVLINE